MWNILYLSLLLGVLVFGVDDFANALDGYTFIYHDGHDLLVVKKNDTCYYVQIMEFFEGQLSSGFFRDRAERNIINIIESNGTALVQPSTFSDMRDKHQDISANFLCIGSEIFEITVDESDLVIG